MFLLNGKPLPLDTPFTVGEGDEAIQLPANWLRLADPMERLALGITEEPDPVRADDRFYWNGDINNPKALEDRLETKEDGSPLWVQGFDPTANEGQGAMVDTTEQVVSRGLKHQFIQQVKRTAGTLLSSTDWMVIRNYERGVAIPANVVTYRNAVIAEANLLEQQISAVTTVKELAALQFKWPEFK